jgi:hypothetical protein
MEYELEMVLAAIRDLRNLLLLGFRIGIVP